MTINEIRTKYIEFFKARGHVAIPSASLVPQNDPTTLFTGSGMQPLVPYLLGEEHPQGARVVNSQKCFRAEDIEEVGDNRHTTFFEMLGNWSLGDYFKEEQLTWCFEFLVNEIGIDPTKLYVTAFAGDEKNNLPRDTDAAEIWQKLFATKNVEARIVEIGSESNGARLGMRGGRIFYYDAQKNWWSRAGVPENMPAGEPGGPDSELFYDFGTAHDPKFGAACHPNCDCGRFLEIGNSVFMQYLKTRNGFSNLPKKNVDFGGGLERITMAANNNADVFAVDIFDDIISLLEKFSGQQYSDSRYTRSFRIIADHVRAAVFILSDGVRPSNSERGYVLRRLIRRAAEHAQKLNVEKGQGTESILNRCAVIILEKYGPMYTDLASEQTHSDVTTSIWDEEKQFGHVLAESVPKVIEAAKNGLISGAMAFHFVTTLGIPLETIKDIAMEYHSSIDLEGFRAEMEKHREISKAGSERKFKGGLADTSLETTRLHTAHHLLLHALQLTLGDHVKQRGSNITSERLRIDFSHGGKLTSDEKANVERIVNEKILEQLPVLKTVMLREEAESLHAEHEFGAKYPDMVTVYSIGPKDATEKDPKFQQSFSIEFCGGPHASNTKELQSGGTFKIVSEESVASGVRRIKAKLIP